ncbi:MAG TPA: hypothetical protein VGI23_05645, partial [Steroidobacteraceae bacterium]
PGRSFRIRLLLEPLRRIVIEKTEGNPLFMEEIFQGLLEGGSLKRNGGVKLARPVERLRLPPTVQGILSSRIDRLPPEEKDLLQTLAVIGTEFPLSLVRQVVQIQPDHLDDLAICRPPSSSMSNLRARISNIRSSTR